MRYPTHMLLRTEGDAAPGTSLPGPERRIWDTTRFRTPTGEAPALDTVAYGFFSLGYPADARRTPPFVVDDYEVWIHVGKVAQESEAE